MKFTKEQKQYLVKVSLVFILSVLLFNIVSAGLPKVGSEVKSCFGTDKVKAIKIDDEGRMTLTCSSDLTGGANATNETDPYWTGNSSSVLTSLTEGSNITITGSGNSRTIGINIVTLKSFFDTIYQTIGDYFTKSQILSFGYYNSSNFPYTHLANFTDNLGNRGYTSLSNFSNDGIFITNSTMNKSVSCSNIFGSPDSDFCTDATGSGGDLTEWINISSNKTEMLSKTSASNTMIESLNTTLNANTNYTFYCQINFMSNVSTTGIALAMNFSSNPSNLSYNIEIPAAADGVGGAFQGWGTGNADFVVGTGVQTANTNYTAEINGMVQVNSIQISGRPTFRTETAVNVGEIRVWRNDRSSCRWTQLPTGTTW